VRSRRVERLERLVPLLLFLVLALRGVAGDAAEAAWAGTVPGLAWLAWRARRSSVAPQFWVVWVYAVAVSLRLFLHGWPCAVAAGPTVAPVWHLVRRGLVPRPVPAAFGLIAVVAVVLPVRGEVASLSRAWRAEPVVTRLGTVRVTRHMAADIEELRPHLDAAAAGPLFVLGGGPGWYPVTTRRNPTGFDLIWNGIGTTDPEASRILADLRADPPAVVIVERGFDGAPLLTPGRVWAAIGATYELRASTRSGRGEMYVASAVARRPGEHRTRAWRHAPAVRD
jgi:hypothetical protein